MRVFLTGGAGFLGREVARLLVARGDAVRVLVPDTERALPLRELGCHIVSGDLSDEAALVTALRGSQALVHCAYLDGVGLPESRRAELVDTNVRGTERMLGAALTAGIHKAVHVSTAAVLGSTGGRVADETWTRDPCLPWASVRDETRAIAHGRAQDLSARGLPLTIVMPGMLYGPADPGPLGLLAAQLRGGHLHALAFPDLGITPVHRDDAAAGVLAALDKGAPGESYLLAGEPVLLRELVALLAEVAGRRAPRLRLPTGLLKALSPVGQIVGRTIGLGPNLAEVVRSFDGATFWVCSDKAQRELGWSARPLREGLVDLV